MAGAQCSQLNFSLPIINKQQVILSISSFSTYNPTKRTNHLRKKLLKTLTKPYTKPIKPVDPPRLEKFYESIKENDVTFSQEKAEIGDVGSVIKGEFGKYWVFKLGLYLVGILVFQMVCAVWVFGSDDIVREEGKDSVFEGKSSERSNLLLNEKSNILLNGNGNLGKSDLEERLREIQAMAREVRESERKKSKVDKEGDGGVFRTEIEKEVESRLLKVQKKLESIVKMPAVPEEDDLESNDKIVPLMIKKKYRFRSPSGSLGDKPQGFMGKKDRVRESDNGLVAIEYEISVFDSLGKAKELGKARMQNKSKMGATQDEHLKGKAGQWWLSLPYVVAVMMGRGHDGEDPRGLFTLKINPYANDEDDLSHIVAFEDRGDATNFCYILESFFEDLGDFRADIVPLSVKELAEEVKSHSKKVVVVKKGQVKLYAGQPLAEVETVLRSLVE